jgi:hypothetical protein
MQMTTDRLSETGELQVADQDATSIPRATAPGLRMYIHNALPCRASSPSSSIPHSQDGVRLCGGGFRFAFPAAPGK